MAEQRRVIRWAPIAYQPNLQSPTDPVPLGVVVEEKHGGRRQVILLGRIPTGAERELQIGEKWGPFRDVVTNWFELVAKNIAELMSKTPTNTFIADGLLPEWNSNVHMMQPENVTAGVSVSLERVARERYKEFVGQDLPPLPGERQPKRPAGRKRVNYMMQATV